LNDFFQNHDELVEALQPLIPSMSLNPKVLGMEAAILHERLQAQLAALALEQIMLPQVEPPPIPLRNGRPNWRELPDGVAIVSFHMTDDELVGSLVHRGQASHWQVEDASAKWTLGDANSEFANIGRCDREGGGPPEDATTGTGSDKTIVSSFMRNRSSGNQKRGGGSQRILVAVPF